MTSMLTSFTWAEVPGVFLAYLLIIAIPTALAWVGAAWLAKKIRRAYRIWAHDFRLCRSIPNLLLYARVDT